jgi:uncharacterized membrane protein YbhN (UPF0104 family)
MPHNSLTEKKADIDVNRFSRFWVIVILLASITFLVYKLATYTNYNLLLHELKSMPLQNFAWLLFTFFLLPLNWLTESIKWKIIVSETQEISLKNALKSVLAGFSTGFITPNRVGDFVGRILFLNQINQKTGIILSLINSLTQNIVIALFGIPAALLFFAKSDNQSQISLNYFILVSIILILLILFYIFFPRISRKIKSEKIGLFIKGINNYSYQKQLNIILFGVIRFVIFSVQFYAMLCFFGVQINVYEAFIAIPANYLFVTFTPSAGFSEPIIRSSYAAFFVGEFSPQTLGIILSGTGIWLINYVISMIVGNIFIIGAKKNREQSEQP